VVVVVVVVGVVVGSGPVADIVGGVGWVGVFGGGLLWWLGRDFEGPEDW